ncbi:uncharacterized protein [Henckelia pumila]|uniref:uncharacterized protein isoform X2 n=1 Tax=Henckelia pumila TaxID=405737 RepID=UPI003C6E0A84
MRCHLHSGWLWISWRRPSQYQEVPPAELEHLLQSISDVADVAVIPYPDCRSRPESDGISCKKTWQHYLCHSNHGFHCKPVRGKFGSPASEASGNEYHIKST